MLNRQKPSHRAIILLNIMMFSHDKIMFKMRTN